VEILGYVVIWIQRSFGTCLGEVLCLTERRSPERPSRFFAAAAQNDGGLYRHPERSEGSRASSRAFRQQC